MKKLLVLFAAAVLTTACSHNQDANQQDSHPSAKSQSETQSKDQAAPQKSTETSKGNKTVKKETMKKENGGSGKTSDTKMKDTSGTGTAKTADLGFISFRPKAGIKKTFLQNKKYEVTYDITAENQKYVQRVVHLGASTTLQILQWGKDKVSAVYQEQNPTDTSNQLNSFKADGPPELLISLNGSDKGAKWQVVGTGKTVTVPYGKFDNVSVIRETEKTENGTKVKTAYYAPGMGLIKEIEDVSGDNGYHTVTVLKAVTPLSS